MQRCESKNLNPAAWSLMEQLRAGSSVGQHPFLSRLYLGKSGKVLESKMLGAAYAEDGFRSPVHGL